MSSVHGSCTNLSSTLKLCAFKIQMTAKTTLQWWSLDNGDSFFLGEKFGHPRSKTFSNKMKFPAKWPSNMVGRGMILYLNNLGRMVGKLSLNSSIAKHDKTSVGTIPQYPWEPQNSTHASSITERTISRSSTPQLNKINYQKTELTSVWKAKSSSKPSLHFNHPPQAPTVRQGSIDSPHSCHR